MPVNDSQIDVKSTNIVATLKHSGGVLAVLRLAVCRLLNPTPIGLKAIGCGSLFMRPRQIIGRQFIEVGERTLIEKYSSLHAIQAAAGERFKPHMHIGNDVLIHAYAWITCADQITIEDGCVLSKNVYITDVEHGYDPLAGPLLAQKLSLKGSVHIGTNSFIGFGACILPGVTLGRHCIVGTRAVVTHSFPDYSMVVGSPARLIKVYSHEERRWIPVI